MTRILLLFFIYSLGLGSGGALLFSSTFVRATEERPRLVVYSSQKEHILRELVETFEKEQGVEIRLVYDQAGPLITRLQSEGQSSQADLLMAVDAGNLWLATERDLLRSVESRPLHDSVPAPLRDPQDRWFGLSVRARTIIYNPQQVNPATIKSYKDLASSEWKGKLCLRTSQHVYNQSLVAVMLKEMGENEAEQMVRGWVDNLAAPVFANDTQMIEAVAAGQCQLGVSNSYYLARVLSQRPDLGVKIHWPEKVHVNIFGAGVTRSSSQPELGQKFLEWLVSKKGQEIIARANFEYPVNPEVEASPLVQSWGLFSPLDINLSVAGSHQSQAVRLMDRARYR